MTRNRTDRAYSKWKCNYKNNVYNILVIFYISFILTFRRTV